MPIAGVADIVDQSAVAPLKQVGASRDLSEATRRRAVRALWGTVTHTPVVLSSFLLVFPISTARFEILDYTELYQKIRRSHDI